ncbi:hypothetical protein BDV96DRAFT_583040 [Lophiotrema nucula]|uniref:Uncharacterized protein n=1 Tax=Lophiotrema nucula TaxID=690887 RepID=A0A6A5YVN4_9PLEO|nr:hypothetical protein BDV96DRAFT_583040 [Lophiotrema nucula]
MVPTRSTRGHTSYISGLVAENARDHWDFNSTQPLPWQAPGASHVPAAPKIRDVPTREFGKCKDRDLLDYLARRRVTRGFLAEIDQFLRANPDIATYSPPFIERLNSLPPLDAYLFFVKGYTRPARYIEGLISSAPFVLPPGFQYRAIQYTEDAELDDFFAGFEYRYDILERIDREVYFACIDMQAGRPVSTSLRRLVCYAVFGNPVDAYKWYEYSYQQDYLPHRYIPEHVVLADVPKPGTYTEPEPSVVKPWNTHADVRFRMARAKDEGVDVIDVLLSEFRFALVRKRLRRCEIDDLYVDARRRIDEERENPTNVDIVDMIMDGAVSQQFRAPLAPKAVPRRNNRTALDEAAEDLREQKTLLQRLYAQEETTFTRSKRPADIAAVRTSRGNTERRYVNALVRYKRINNQMRPFEAQDIQSQFTRKKMGNVGPVNKDYLLSLFPRELL